jgi:quercetin dioxygenase-like cupin family protein
LAPAKLFLTLASSAVPKFQSQQTSRQQSGDILNHYAIPGDLRGARIFDEVIFGHLTELNGKFKLRATELTFAPDGYIGVHHHVGPGVRYVISGELTFPVASGVMSAYDPERT